MSKERQVIESMLENRAGIISGYERMICDDTLNYFTREHYINRQRMVALESDLLMEVLKRAEEMDDE